MLLNLVWKVVISPFFLGTLRSMKAATRSLSLPFSAALVHPVEAAGWQSTGARFFPAWVD